MLSNVDCYTCRRRRVRCDRALPHCDKCMNKAGLDCLGYKKPLVWNNGVASRGKMMGKTFPLPKSGNRAVVVKQEEEEEEEEEDSSGRSSSSPESEVCGGRGRGRIGGVGKVVLMEKRDKAVVRPPARAGSGTGSGGSCGAYLRPFNPEFFGDLDEKSKYYLNYFDKRVCRDFILFERHGDNPYRNLLSFTAEHPSFLQSALAVSARHYSNNTGTPETQALVYKGRAIRSLSQDLRRPNYDGTNIVREPVLAAMLLFLFFEALESGRDTWKIHLQGARRLIQMGGGMRPDRSNLSASLSVLITHVAAIDIIGKSLAFSGSDTSTLSWGGTLEEVFASLEQAEHYSFLGCPAELLKIIALVSQRKNSLPTSTEAAALLSRISRFDPREWVKTRLPSLNQNSAGSSIPRLDPAELHHHVCAYKCAVHIFALQVLAPCPARTDELVDEIIAHISCFEPGSVFFKGAVWPIFLAGAAATSEFQRTFVRQTLGNIWKLLPQLNIKNAGVLLENIWRDGGGGDWKERLKRTGSDYLFI